MRGRLGGLRRFTRNHRCSATEISAARLAHGDRIGAVLPIDDAVFAINRNSQFWQLAGSQCWPRFVVRPRFLGGGWAFFASGPCESCASGEATYGAAGSAMLSKDPRKRGAVWPGRALAWLDARAIWWDRTRYLSC